MTDTAYHEAGHAVAAYLLRGPSAVTVVSILPTAERSGVTMLASAPIDLRGHGSDPVAADPALRAAVERTLIGVLAGAEAEQIARRASGYVPAEYEAEQIVAVLPPRDRELQVADIDWDFAIERDGDRRETAALSERFAGADEAPAYVGWLRVVAGNLVLRHWAVIERLAAALLARNTLTGAEVAEIIEGGADGTT